MHVFLPRVPITPCHVTSTAKAMHTSNLSSNSTWHITPGATRSVIYDAQFRFPRRWKHHIRRHVYGRDYHKKIGNPTYSRTISLIHPPSLTLNLICSPKHFVLEWNQVLLSTEERPHWKKKSPAIVPPNLFRSPPWSWIQSSIPVSHSRLFFLRYFYFILYILVRPTSMILNWWFRGVDLYMVFVM